MKKIFSLIIAFLIAASMSVYAAPSTPAVQLKSKSGILMEQSTGKVLYETNADEKMPPASITKIMTLLLVMEAMEDGKFGLNDMVSCSKHACSMGGTQIWLEPNEQMSVNDLLKATAVVSANDAAVALGEFVAGSEPEFVNLMNKRAKELGMKNTTFMNASGLDAVGHLSSARDIAIMSRELMKHTKITEYTTIWMDSLRNGKNELVNTNKLIKFYDGATGLKTGTTDGAGSCLSATATRNGLSLVSVTMGATTSVDRFDSGRALLDYGFAKYSCYNLAKKDITLPQIKVKSGDVPYLKCKIDNDISTVIEKGKEKSIRYVVDCPKEIVAPVAKDAAVGKIKIFDDKTLIFEKEIKASQMINKLDMLKALKLLINNIFN